jgi:L-2-hydroxyglutarate oxidase LhgO
MVAFDHRPPVDDAACLTLQVDKLRALHRNAHLNGAVDVRWISVEEARAMEPELHCLAAIFSPSTGIVDGKG